MNDWVGLRVEIIRELSNGFYKAPAGTKFVIREARAGLRLLSERCACCGVQVYISKVDPRDVRLIDLAG